MRDEEVDDASAARRDELRDIHHRIDRLTEESERQFIALSKDLHALEVAVARGTKFPAAAWVAALGLAITIVATGAALFAKLETTHLMALQAFDAIKGHITEMGPAEQVVWKLDEKVKALESRIVGIGPNGWHRSDHETYAEMVRAQMGALEQRLHRAEEQQAALCQRIQSCGGKR